MVRHDKTFLAEELSYYESHRAEWVRSHDGEFAAISGKTLGGFFPNYEKAFEASLRRFGVDSAFLIKQVLEHEPVFSIY